MKKIFLITSLSILTMTTLNAECTKTERLKMIDSGYQKEEIESICASSNSVTTSNSQEDWYIKIGLGPAWMNYDSSLQKYTDSLEDDPNIDRLTIGIDLGVYFPLDTQSLIGFNLSGSSDSFEGYGEDYSFNLYNYALSYIYNFNKIRDGFFVRGDIGFSTWIEDSSVSGTNSSDFGLGLGIGAGYAFEFGGWGIEPELLLNYYSIEGNNEVGTHLLMNFLF